MAFGAREAWLGNLLVTVELAVSMLNTRYPDVHLQWDDLVNDGGDWAIDSMDPYEWCEAMNME